MKKFVRLLQFAGLFVVATVAMAQPPRGPLVVSLRVNVDRTVPFRYQAPQTKMVELSAQFEKGRVAMTKDALWQRAADTHFRFYQRPG